MNKYLLDTNVISELRKQKPHGAVLQWLGELRSEHLFISVVTLAELQSGVERTRIQDPPKAAEIEIWIDRFASSFQMIPMDAVCFREWARLMHGKSDDLFEDAMIAATARVHGLIVATRNEADFRLFDVRIFNPFKPRS